MADPFADLVPQAHADPFASLVPQHAHNAFADLVPRTPSSGAPPPRAPKVELATGVNGKPKRENLLRTLGEAMEVPMSMTHAWLRGDNEPGAGFSWAGDVPKAIDTLRKHGMNALNEEYGTGSSGEMQYGVAHGDPIMAARQAHPLLNAGMTLGEEMFNPSNLVGGKIVGGAAKLAGAGIKAARTASPMLNEAIVPYEEAAAQVARPFQQASRAAKRAVGKAVVKAVDRTTAPVRSAFSRYARGKIAGGRSYADAMLSLDRLPPAEKKHVEDLTAQVFGHDLTPAQKAEVVKRSYVNERGKRVYAGDASIPEPKGGLSLDQRGALYRKAYRDITPQLVHANLLDTQLPTGMYDPRKIFSDRAVYAGQEASDADAALQSVSTSGRGRPSGKFAAGSISRRGHAALDRLPLHEVDPAELSPEFDPAHQFYNDLIEKHGKLAVERGKRGLEKVYGTRADGTPTQVDPLTGKPAPARVPVIVEKDGHVFGRGESGVAALAKHLNDLSHRGAYAEAASDPAVAQLVQQSGWGLEDIVKARSLESRAAALRERLREARSAEQRSGKLADYVASRYEKTKDAVSSDLYRDLEGRAKQVDHLNAEIAKAREDVAAGGVAARAKQLDAMVRERDAYLQRIEKVAADVEKAASPFGTPPLTGRLGQIAQLSDKLPYGLGWRVREALGGLGGTHTAASIADIIETSEHAGDPTARRIVVALRGLAKKSGEESAGTTGLIDETRKSVEKIPTPDVHGLAESAERQRAAAARGVDRAYGRYDAAEGARRSLAFTGNEEADNAILTLARHRSDNQAYLERHMPLEDAAGGISGSVRVAGNANRAAGWNDPVFTKNDITWLRARLSGTLGRRVQTSEALDLAHNAFRAVRENGGKLAEPPATAAQEAQQAARRLSGAGQAVRDQLTGLDAVDRATQRAIDLAKTTGAKGAAAAAKRDAIAGLDRMAAAAQEAPGKAVQAATGGALQRVVESMGNVARAGVDASGEAAVGRMERVAARELGALERTAGNVYKRRTKMLKPSEDASLAANAAARTSRARSQVISSNERQMQDILRAREAFDARYEEAYKRISAQMGRHYDDAVRAPKGYRLESKLGQGSPSGQYKALDETFADFFEQNPSLRPQLADPHIRGAMRFFGWLNQLSRASIVFFPQVHAINNEGMAYLAEGGSPERMFKILIGHHDPAPDVLRRAERAGATADATRVMFDDVGAHEEFTPSSQLVDETRQKHGPVAAALKRASLYAKRDARIPERVPVVGGKSVSYDGFNRWLFDKVERGYRVDTFQRLTEAGMSDGEAARKVNAAFGRVGDLSELEQRARMSKLFYFWPWTKTVVGYWARKGVVDPKWWQAPERAIEVNNQQQGFDDPSKPFTATLGKRANGDFRRVTIPVPQRILENVAEAARVPLDIAQFDFQGAREDAAAPINYVSGHASLPLSMLLDALQAAQGGGRGSLPPYNVWATDPNDPGWKQAATIAGKMAGHVLAPIDAAGRVAQDPLSGAVGYATGAFAYGAAPAAKKKDEHKVRAMFGPLIKAAQLAHNDRAVAQLMAERDAAVKRVDAKYAPK